jgi:phosphatidylglycerophosphatase C
MHKRKIAVFDFDGTITKRDTFLPFMLSYGSEKIIRSAFRTVFQRGKGNFRNTIKTNVIREIFAGYPTERFLHDAVTYAGSLQNKFREDTLDHIADHKARGHGLVMVTASLASYTRPIGSLLGFDHVIGVELEAKAEFLTGEIVGNNVRGTEKARLFKEWLGEEEAEIWGYGNSRGDREMLAMADHSIWVK